MKSENWGGIVSLFSSTALIANSIDFSKLATEPLELSTYGQSPGAILAALQFTAAELLLSAKGDKTWGYSAGAALFATGDITLAYTVDDKHLQYTLIAMAAAWGLGSLRYPFAVVSKQLKNNLSANFNKVGNVLETTANTIPKITGTTNLALRLPGIIAAGKGGEYIVAGAIAGWGAADILTGRLQDSAKEAYIWTKSKIKPQDKTGDSHEPPAP